ncbi:MAG: endonuclease/exonuclease/phosphatase family protein [Syntrophotaleaceae bacterium]
MVIGLALILPALLRAGQMPLLPKLLLLLLLLAVGFQGVKMFPYSRLSPFQVKQAAADGNSAVIRLVTCNVLMENRNLCNYLKVLQEADPDVILTTEADQWWADQLAILDSAYPWQVKHPLPNTYGMILHSRFPLIDPAVRFLIEPDVPSIHTALQLPDGRRIHLVGLHPRPPVPSENEDTAERDAELYLIGKMVSGSDLPVLVLGDLNDVAWSRTTSRFQKVSGLLDPRIGRGMYNTFHADYFFLRFPLDHIFHSRHFRHVSMKRLSHIGSDHFPFFVALTLTGNEASEEHQ